MRPGDVRTCLADGPDVRRVPHLDETVHLSLEAGQHRVLVGVWNDALVLCMQAYVRQGGRVTAQPRAAAASRLRRVGAPTHRRRAPTGSGSPWLA